MWSEALAKGAERQYAWRMKIMNGCMIAALSLGLLGGCESTPVAEYLPELTPTDRVAVHVTLKFERVRTFLTADGRDGDDEWDLIAPIVRKYHVTGNTLGVEYRMTPTPRPNPPAGMRVTDYTVEMVVESMSRLAAMHDEIAAKRGKIVQGQRVDFAASHVQVTYSTPFVRPEIEALFFGKAGAGDRVYIFDHGAVSPNETVAGPDGRWSRRARINPRLDYLYGYVVDSAGVTRHFRINVVNRVEETLTATQFEQMRAAGG